MIKNLTFFLLGLSVLLFTSIGSYRFFKTNRPDVKSLQSVGLLQNPVSLSGNKSIATYTQKLGGISPENKNAIEIYFDHHGLCLLNGDAGSIVFDQGDTKSAVLLAQYVKNCNPGLQTVTIPLSQIEGFSNTQPIRNLQFSFWYPSEFKIDFTNINLTTTSENVLGAIELPQVPEGKNFTETKLLRPHPYAQRSIE